MDRLSGIFDIQNGPADTISSYIGMPGMNSLRGLVPSTKERSRTVWPAVSDALVPRGADPIKAVGQKEVEEAYGHQTGLFFEELMAKHVRDEDTVKAVLYYGQRMRGPAFAWPPSTPAGVGLEPVFNLVRDLFDEDKWGDTNWMHFELWKLVFPFLTRELFIYAESCLDVNGPRADQLNRFVLYWKSQMPHWQAYTTNAIRAMDALPDRVFAMHNWLRAFQPLISENRALPLEHWFQCPIEVRYLHHEIERCIADNQLNPRFLQIMTIAQEFNGPLGDSYLDMDPMEILSPPVVYNLGYLIWDQNEGARFDFQRASEENDRSWQLVDFLMGYHAICRRVEATRS